MKTEINGVRFSTHNKLNLNGDVEVRVRGGSIKEHTFVIRLEQVVEDGPNDAAAYFKTRCQHHYDEVLGPYNVAQTVLTDLMNDVVVP